MFSSSSSNPWAAGGKNCILLMVILLMMKITCFVRATIKKITLNPLIGTFNEHDRQNMLIKMCPPFLHGKLSKYSIRRRVWFPTWIVKSLGLY